MLIVGLNAYHGDVAAAVLRDGVLVAAVEEERFCRSQARGRVSGARDSRAGLRMAGATPADVDVWAVARGRRVHLLQKALVCADPSAGRGPAAAVSRPPPARAQPCRRSSPAPSPRHWRASRRGRDTSSITRPTWPARISYERADGGRLLRHRRVRRLRQRVDGARPGRRGSTLLDRVYFPHSLGLLYLAITQYLGLQEVRRRVQGDGPGALRNAAARRGDRRLVRLDRGGRLPPRPRLLPALDRRGHHDLGRGEPAMPDVFTARLDRFARTGPPPDEPVTSRHEDLAASLQHVFEERGRSTCCAACTSTYRSTRSASPAAAR